jgi:hypothetical protein
MQVAHANGTLTHAQIDTKLGYIYPILFNRYGNSTAAGDWDGYYGTSLACANTSVTFFPAANFIIPETGTYKLYMIHSNSVSNQANSGVLYGVFDDLAAWDTSGALDITNNATAYTKKHTDMGNFSLTAGKCASFAWSKDTNEGAGTLYVFGFYLVKQ